MVVPSTRGPEGRVRRLGMSGIMAGINSPIRFSSRQKGLAGWDHPVPSRRFPTLATAAQKSAPAYR